MTDTVILKHCQAHGEFTDDCLDCGDQQFVDQYYRGACPGGLLPHHRGACDSVGGCYSTAPSMPPATLKARLDAKMEADLKAAQGALKSQHLKIIDAIYQLRCAKFGSRKTCIDIALQCLGDTDGWGVM